MLQGKRSPGNILSRSEEAKILEKLYQLDKQPSSSKSKKRRSENASFINFHSGSQFITVQHPHNSDINATIIFSSQARDTNIIDIVQWRNTMTGNLIELEKAPDGSGFKVFVDAGDSRSECCNTVL
jgi:hypothetical protein